MVASKHAFWQALVFTIIIFSIGLIFGYYLETSRAEKIRAEFARSEVNLLDNQLRLEVFESFGVDCSQREERLFAFADKVYLDAVKLETYDAASKFGDRLKDVHRKYDLLRLQIWTESIALKRACNSTFHTYVYFYGYDSEDVQLKAVQGSVSRVLTDLKSTYPDQILLIPLAGNLDIDSIDFIRTHYGLTSLPVIIVDERLIIEGLTNFKDLERPLFQTPLTNQTSIF